MGTHQSSPSTSISTLHPAPSSGEVEVVSADDGSELPTLPPPSRVAFVHSDRQHEAPVSSTHSSGLPQTPRGSNDNNRTSEFSRPVNNANDTMEIDEIQNTENVIANVTNGVAGPQEGQIRRRRRSRNAERIDADESDCFADVSEMEDSNNISQCIKKRARDSGDDGAGSSGASSSTSGPTTASSSQGEGSHPASPSKKRRVSSDEESEGARTKKKKNVVRSGTQAMRRSPRMNGL